MASLSDTSRKWLTLAAALLPGAGQIACDRPVRGLVCGAAVAVCLCAAMLDAWVTVPLLGAAGRGVLLTVAGGVYLFSLADTALLAWRRYDPRREPQRIEMFRRGNLLAMQGKLPEARAVYMDIVERDRNDVSALLKVALLDHFAGNTESARILLDECRHLDGAAEWRHQIDAACQRIEQPRAETADA